MSADADPATTKLWIYLSLEHTDRISTIQDTIYNAAPQNEYIKPETPHLTLHRGFEIPETERDTIETTVNNLALEGTTVPITHIKLWPSLNKPLIAALDIDSDFSFTDELDALDDAITNVGGDILHERAPPHITLIRAGLERDLDGWDGLDTNDQNRLFAITNAFSTAWETTITDIHIDIYDPPTTDDIDPVNPYDVNDIFQFDSPDPGE